LVFAVFALKFDVLNRFFAPICVFPSKSQIGASKAQKSLAKWFLSLFFALFS